MTKQSLFKLFTFLILCSCIKQKPIIPPKAEITNIYNVTNNSAYVDIEVTKQSNAEVGFLALIIDSMSKVNTKTQVQYIAVTPQSVITFNNKYTIIISNLKSKTLFSIYLLFTGSFDLGGHHLKKEIL